jgi:glucose-6-phosphate isomerase
LRIWRRDSSVFLPPGAPDAAHAGVRQRLGWLDAPTAMAAHLPEIEALATVLRHDGFNEVYLLGMGGSSLCAEVLRDVVPATSGRARLSVLDTTDETAIAEATAALNPDRACFIVASKSGSTIEVTSLERHFWSLMERARGAHASRHFVAITDPDTSLVKLAAERGYRHTFENAPDIGGRFSALSLFGLVPAALIGLSPADLLQAGRNMADVCRAGGLENPALALGTFMAEAAAAHRDKLTVILPDSLAALGAWIEQLVAESTGKDGRGVLPVVGQPLESPEGYGPDRAFVVTSLGGPDDTNDSVRRIAAAGHPVFHVTAREGDVGAEFFRWEFATAVAGAVLGVNPFDEPNVREAKERTRQQLDDRRRLGRFRVDPPLEAEAGFSWRAHRATERISDGRYVAILDYLPADAASRTAVAACRTDLQHAGTWAVTHGIGPRYLHSTGQYHKGGPNTGFFLLLTTDDPTATPVPGADYTFSTLKHAQALGDFDALAAAGRHVLHYHLRGAADLAAARSHILAQLRA